MTDAEKSRQTEAQKKLGKFKRKAENCRYAHSCLADNIRWWRCFTDIVVAVLTLALSVLVMIFYRTRSSNWEMFSGWEDHLAFGIGVLPILILFVQTMGKIFNLAKKETAHDLAIHIWGIWIRDADFFEKTADDPMSEIDREKMSGIQRKYIECMDKTPLIPRKKFLFYKIALRRRMALAEKIDDAQGENGELLQRLDEIELKCVKAEKEKLWRHPGKGC